MPALTEEQYAALRADIEARGIVVRVVVDQHGRLLDGHHRRKIAAELGIDCPVEVRKIADDDEAADLAVSLNCVRRHLTREQVRDVIRAELARRPEDSDRAVARRVGCSPSTVGAVRRGEVSNLDTPMSRSEAQQRTDEIRAALARIRTDLQMACIGGLSNAMPARTVWTAIRTRAGTVEREHGPGPSWDVLQRAVFGPLLDWLADPKTADQWRPEWDHPTFKPLTELEYADVLKAIAGVA